MDILNSNSNQNQNGDLPEKRSNKIYFKLKIDQYFDFQIIISEAYEESH